MQICSWIEETYVSAQGTGNTARSDQSYEDSRVYLSSMCYAMQVGCWFEESPSWPLKKGQLGAEEEMLMCGMAIVYKYGAISVHGDAWLK